HGGILDEIIEGEEDLLHADTAGEILEVMKLGGELVAELTKRLPPGDPIHTKIADYGAKSAEVIVRIADITVNDEADPDQPEGDVEDTDADTDDVNEEDDDAADH